MVDWYVPRQRIADTYFTMASLGRHVEMKAVFALLLTVPKMAFGVPELTYYALADGARDLLLLNGKCSVGSAQGNTLQYLFSLFKT